MIDRSKLTREHAELAEIAAALLRAVDDPAPDVAGIIRLRWQLGYKLAVHLAAEDQHVYPLVKAHADPHIVSVATSYEAEMGGLHQQYRAHMAGWHGARIAAEWAAFRAELEGLLGLLARRIEREECGLYPLLETGARRVALGR